MLAALDETFPELGNGVAYVVAATVVIADEAAADAALAGIFADPNRTRPFHWHEEGPQARSNIIDRMEELGAVALAVVRYPTGRKGLETARARCLEAIVPALVHEGTEHLVIESRGPVEDARDRSVLIDALKDVEPSASFSYRFDGKARRVLWMADAVCGAIREHLIDPANATYYDRLQEAGILPAQLLYVGT